MSLDLSFPIRAMGVISSLSHWCGLAEATNYKPHMGQAHIRSTQDRADVNTVLELPG